MADMLTSWFAIGRLICYSEYMAEDRYKAALERIIRETHDRKDFISRRLNGIAFAALNEKERETA